MFGWTGFRTVVLGFWLVRLNSLVLVPSRLRLPLLVSVCEESSVYRANVVLCDRIGSSFSIAIPISTSSGTMASRILLFLLLGKYSPQLVSLSLSLSHSLILVRLFV